MSEAEFDGISATFEGPDGHSLVVEETDTVAYAYLLDAKKEIVSDVWLYNRQVAPSEPPWNFGKDPPFMNPRENVTEDSFTPPLSAGQLSVNWSCGTAMLAIDGITFAILSAGSHPGWSKLAVKSSPCARRLQEKLS